MNVNFTRRDFLKASGLGLAGLFMPRLPLHSFFDDFFDSQQGRVTANLLWTYDRPAFTGKQVKLFWRDLVLPITDIAISDDQTAYNRVWYQIGDQGYAYSGDIQPVQTVLNAPVSDIPTGGVLGEVSVPFTDALDKPDGSSAFGYRLYYESVHWIERAIPNRQDGKIWYEVLDDKWDQKVYAPGAHLRILSDDELSPLSTGIPDAQKRIEVHLTDQLLFAYENEHPVFVTRVASGEAFSNGTYTTPTGSFTTYHKRPTRHMAAGDLTANGFDLPGVPWVMYINESGISLHGTYWHNDFGHPHSHGCVNLSPSSAKWLFRWTKPLVAPHDEFAYDVFHQGTRVQIMD
jgi:lipoprotein-anchoring transpeptidase ErfK/SrfK